jgi:hypothetical protein
MAKLRSMMLGKVKGHEGQATLGDIIDFDRIFRKMQGEEEVAIEEARGKKKSTDPLQYLERNMQEMATNQCLVINVPPDPTTDMAIVANWLWYTGKCTGLTDIGIRSCFFVNKTFIQLPCLVVKPSLLSAMNSWYKDSERSCSYKDFGTPEACDTNCCCGSSWTLHDFRAKSSKPLITRDFERCVESFAPAHHIFKKVPGRDLLVLPLEPVATKETSWDINISSWGLLWDSKVVELPMETEVTSEV